MFFLSRPKRNLNFVKIQRFWLLWDFIRAPGRIKTRRTPGRRKNKNNGFQQNPNRNYSSRSNDIKAMITLIPIIASIATIKLLADVPCDVSTKPCFSPRHNAISQRYDYVKKRAAVLLLAIYRKRKRENDIRMSSKEHLFAKANHVSAFNNLLTPCQKVQKLLLPNEHTSFLKKFKPGSKNTETTKTITCLITCYLNHYFLGHTYIHSIT